MSELPVTDESVRQPPKIHFPGGYVQIANPRYPINNVWSDLLHLDPNGELPAHTHTNTSSLLICINGHGEIGVNGKSTILREGVCVFIPAGSDHYVRAADTESLNCLSINEGIIKPGGGTDLIFSHFLSEKTKSEWRIFSQTCADTANDFQQRIKKDGGWHCFQLDLSNSK